MSLPKCPQCAVTMEEGFVPDLGHLNSPSAPKWTEGVPERSFWQGLKMKGKEQYPVTTYRCPRCGMLQSYARPA